jgi:1-acyl-sn-glycerol-3-phosphate acyltransferase
MKAQVYKDPRPAEHFSRFHERTRSRRPDWVYELVRLVLTPYLLFLYRARCIDSHWIPADGPAIIAPNHFSFLDHFFVAVYLRRKVHFMAKSQLFQRPMQFIYTHGGVFPVRRGHHDEEAFKTAHAVLARGDIVVMYAEAGRSRSGELGKPRHGLGRLALESGATVVPTAIAGTERARGFVAPALRRDPGRLHANPLLRRSARGRREECVDRSPPSRRPRPHARSCVRALEAGGEERFGHRGGRLLRRSSTCRPSSAGIRRTAPGHFSRTSCRSRSKASVEGRAVPALVAAEQLPLCRRGAREEDRPNLQKDVDQRDDTVTD